MRAPLRCGARTASALPRCCAPARGPSLPAHRSARPLCAARALAARRLRPPGRGRRQRVRPAALGLPLRRARQGAEARIDAWVTPPVYTGKPPIMLADGGYTGCGRNVRPGRSRSRSAASSSCAPVAQRSASSRSRSTGVDGRAAEPGGASAGNRNRRVRDQARAAPLRHGDGLRRRHQSASWPFVVTPDQPPKIALTKEPERTPRGALKLTFKVEDDYGVVSAESRIRRLRAQAGQIRPRRGRGPTPRRARARRTSVRRPWRCVCRAPTRSWPRGRASTSSAIISGPACAWS